MKVVMEKIMKTRTLGRTALEVSAVSLGTEYLINLPRHHVVEVIHKAIERGINYFDLFWAQAEFRDTMGAAFKGYREKVLLAAHLGSADINGQYERTRDPALCERFFLDFLARYRTEYVDILFLHNSESQEDYDGLMRPDGLREMATRYQREGKTRYIGFSGHNASTSRQAAECGAIDVLMFPLSFTNHAMPGRPEMLEACITHNVGLVAMKPFAGGNLLREERTIEVADYQMGRTEAAGSPMKFMKSKVITPVQCLSYILDQRGVSTAVPGCANTEQLEAALAYFDATAEEKKYAALLADFDRYRTGVCIHCNHCLPCPANIDIGHVLQLLQMAHQDRKSEAQTAYDTLSADASDCIQCGDCAGRCPFGVEVVAQMEEAVGMLG
jgi:predicted aldo/keto reductase-like oxidoreductase